jgi:hypothetical protein
MATIIKIKRSSGTSTPNLGQGEIGYSWGTGTYTDAQSATVTSYGKMFLGTGTETGGIAANIEIIGGKYFTDMLDHGHGTLTANSGVIVDSAKKIDEWNVDNITLNGNTISTTNTNGDLTIDTNGTGDVIIAGANTSGTNLFNITDGTSTRFSVDSFSGATTISSGTLTASEELLNISSTWNNNGSTFYGIKFDVTNTASGINSRLIDLGVGGATKFNVDVSGNVYLAGNITAGSATDISIQDNTANAYRIKEGTNEYLNFTTTNTVETIAFGNSLTAITNIVKDNVANAYVLKEGTSQYIAIDTTNSSELVKFETGNVQITNDLAVNGGDITTTSTGTATVFNTNATTLNVGGAATTIALGNTGTGARTVNIGTAATGGASTLTFGGAVTGNILKIAGTTTGTVNVTTDVTTGTANIFASITTGTVNIATGGASTTNFGSATGNSTVNIRGNGTSGTATLGTNVTTGIANVFTTVTGTINYGAATTTHDFGNLVVKGNTIYTDVVGSTQLVLDPFPAGGDSAGEVLIRGNLTVAGTTTTVNSTEVSVNDPIFTIGDSVSSKVVISNASSAATSLIIDNPSGIVENSSVTGSNVAGGTTITNIRTRFYTSAQMAGTQTAGTTVIYTYNTSNTTYEAIGVYVGKGANYLEIDLNSNIALREDDYYVGIELRDANTGTPNSATVSRDPANNKVFTTGATLTISAGLTSGITAPQEITISQGADDNMDRGIQFKYYNGSLKTGFFGYDESGIAEDVTTYYFTYIPDATNTNNIFGGTVGSAYFKTVKINDGVTNGIAFYDAYKRLTTTVAAGTSDATTSNQILTVNGSGVPTWTTTLDGGTY